MLQTVIIKKVSLTINHRLVSEAGSSLIFLHDSLGYTELWRDFPPQIGEATLCNVLVYDRQGYGKSSPFGNTDRENNYLEVEVDILNALTNTPQIQCFR